jgi:hypothetical protein
MMSSAAALRTALELVHMPSQVRFIRSDPLPNDVVLLLRIAAGDAEAEKDAVDLTDRPRDVIRRAAAFYIEQNLLFAGADCYRVLGANWRSTSAELRRNMALLLRWLHPDMDRQVERSVLARRVITAWETLKTPERRAAYDRMYAPRAAQVGGDGGLRDIWAPAFAPRRAAASPDASALRRQRRKGLLRRGLQALLGRLQR